MASQQDLINALIIQHNSNQPPIQEMAPYLARGYNPSAGGDPYDPNAIANSVVQNISNIQNPHIPYRMMGAANMPIPKNLGGGDNNELDPTAMPSIPAGTSTLKFNASPPPPNNGVIVPPPWLTKP